MPKLEAGTTLVARYEVKALETSPHLDVEQWHAEDKIFGREVCVYVLDEKVPSGALDRARKSAQLNVERVARVIDVIDKGADQRFIITERPDGVTTAAAIAYAPFNMKQTKAVIGTIATSLVKVAQAQGLRHGAITSDSIYFKNDTATLTGLVPRNFLGLNEGVSDEELALRDTKGLAALTYFMLTGLMANYSSSETSPLPKLLGFVEDADKKIDLYTTDILNGTSDTIATPEEFLEALGDWSQDDMPYVHKPEKPLPSKDALPPVPPAPPQRTSARSATSTASAPPSTQPPAAAGTATGAIAVGSVAAFSAGSGVASGAAVAAGKATTGAAGGASAGALGTASAVADAVNATNASLTTHVSSASAEDALAAGGPPRFLPSTNDKTLGAPNTPPVVSPLAQQSSLPTPAHTPASSGFNPTPWVLGLMVIGLLFGLFWAINSLTAPTAPAIVAPTGRPVDPSETAAPQKPVVEEPRPKTESAKSLDPDGDGNEYPDLQDKVVDGDVTTPWHSRTYKTANFGGLAKSGIGLQVGLEKKAKVSSVLISSANTGGKVEIRATDAKNPSKGKVLASGELDGETVFKLSEPTTTDSIVVWFTEMPKDQQGAYRIYIYEISLT